MVMMDGLKYVASMENAEWETAIFRQPDSIKPNSVLVINLSSP
jgi:hypothetical protein